MINVLILDDDPMVAHFNELYLKEIEGFNLMAVAHSYEEAIAKLETVTIDLILLDIYMAGKSGLELLKKIREKEKWSVDVILITAASDVESIQTALRHGAVDYIIKPFDFERFQQALLRYKDKQQIIEGQGHLNQKALDEQLFGITDQIKNELPKGLSSSTLTIILEVIDSIGETSFSTEEIAEKSEISRVSVRKYLKFMAEIGVLGEKMTYGPVGRPTHLYVYKKEKKKSLSKFL
ncbi:response regulator [Salipaludibacillus agaradhaerens]|uniref:response regulator n=1 Tax=Salipaludibacillus agaradhaerens TaxID=76935 RepID=UPI002151A859|nr:response regulator [Salipaludibacillus agaradhaerens]MCR6107904.1 response regulator [Salipaludibacillus agaradhaerens]MCR6119930.1 response regulator [Salipaludibacillus agaradhaerens]